MNIQTLSALTSKRPYKEAWSVEQAVETLDQDAGTHFDPGLVPIFHEILPEALEFKRTIRREAPDFPTGWPNSQYSA